MEKKCRHCAELIKAEANVCPHCGKSQKVTAGEWFSAGLSLIFLGAVGIPLLVLIGVVVFAVMSGGK